MIYNVEIINEYTDFFEVIVYDVTDENGYETDCVKVGKVRKKDVFPNTKIFMEIQIKNYLNNGVIELE